MYQISRQSLKNSGFKTAYSKPTKHVYESWYKKSTRIFVLKCLQFASFIKYYQRLIKFFTYMYHDVLHIIAKSHDNRSKTLASKPFTVNPLYLCVYNEMLYYFLHLVSNLRKECSRGYESKQLLMYINIILISKLFINFFIRKCLRNLVVCLT